MQRPSNVASLALLVERSSNEERIGIDFCNCMKDGIDLLNPFDVTLFA